MKLTEITKPTDMTALATFPVTGRPERDIVSDLLEFNRRILRSSTVVLIAYLQSLWTLVVAARLSALRATFRLTLDTRCF